MFARARGAGLALALLVSSASARAHAAAEAAADEPVRAVWIGGPTLLFRFDPIALLTDPVLGEGAEAFRMIDPNSGQADAMHARLAPLPAVRAEEADLVLLSHDHADHLDQAALARLGAKVRFVVPQKQEAAVRARGVAQVVGLPWRTSHTIRKGDYSVRITALAAQHSLDPEAVKVLGEVNGYWLEFRHGRYRRTVYWTGDSFPVPSEFSSKLRAPDLLVPHLGGVGAGGPFGQVSMGAKEALSFARAVEPKAVLPIHHSTFSLYREPIERFRSAAEGQPWKLKLLDEGGELVLD